MALAPEIGPLMHTCGILKSDDMVIWMWRNSHEASALPTLLLTILLITSKSIEGFTPTFEPRLGTSKGGTRIKVHSNDRLWSFSKPFLRLGLDGEPVAAESIAAINEATLESQFIMPTIPLGLGAKAVVELSFSRYGASYIDMGAFTFYDGEGLESEALSGPDQGGVLALEPSVFPEKFSQSLTSNRITPSCGFHDGTVTPAKQPIFYNNASTAKLSIHCDEGVSCVSLNGQEYFPVPVNMENKHARIMMEAGLTSSKFVQYPYDEEDLGHRLNANSSVNSTTPICNYRTTDTGMGLSIIVAYMVPSYASVNATLSTGVTYIGYGGPLVYVINIIISAPGTYSVISINPSCTGASPPGSFNVSGAPSAQYSSVSITFASGGYTPGTSVVFTVTSADSQGIVPSTQIQGPFPFSVVLNQTDSSSGISYPVPFTSAAQVGGIWRVTCAPTRFLNVTGTVMLGDQFILNGIINFTLIAFTASQASTTFLVRPDVTIPLPAGPVTFSVDSQDIFPKYSVVHLINYKVTDSSGTIILQAMCTLDRATVGCFFPSVLKKAGTYWISVSIDAGTVLAGNASLSVLPGMLSGPKSTFAIIGMSQSTLSQKTAGDTLTATLLMQDMYGNQGNSTFALAGWNTTVTVALRCNRGTITYMNVSAGLGSTTASVMVTSAGLYVASTFIGSSGNALIGSGKYSFNVSPLMANTSGFSANMVVGKMVAGQFTPVWVSLLDFYGNTIDGITLPKSIPVVINCNGQSFNATNNGRIFVLLPGLNVTTAMTGILITASYGSTVVASYNATCSPGPADIHFSNVSIPVQNYVVGSNGSLQLTVMDSWGNAVDPTTHNFPFQGGRLLRTPDLFGAKYTSGCNLNYSAPNPTTNPFFFNFTLPTVAAWYYVSIPLIGKLLETGPVIQVVASYPVGRMCTISGVSGVEPTPGIPYSVYVTPRDMYGNIWYGNMSTLLIIVTDPNGMSIPRSNMTITSDPVMASILTFTTPQKTGVCTIKVWGSYPDSTATTMSFNVVAGDYAQVTLEEVRVAVATQYSTFFFVARDALGYPRDQPGIPGDIFQLVLCNNVSCGHATVNDHHLSGGRYLVTWSAPLTGNYSVTCWTPNNGPCPLSTLTTVASPRTDSVVYYPRCNHAPPTPATCPQFYSVYAGEVATIILQSFNEPVGGPNMSINTGGNLPAVFMTGGSVTSLLDQGDGTYSLSYMATSNAPATLTITNGVPSVIPLKVNPGRTSPLKTFFQFSYNLQANYTAGMIINGGFIAKDSLGNQQDYTQYDYRKDRFQLIATRSAGVEIRGTNTFYPYGMGEWGTVVFLNLAGTFTLQATLNGYTIPLVDTNGNPLTTSGFLVVPGPPYAAAVAYPPPTMQFYNTAGGIGGTAMYSINDQYGNFIPQSLYSCSACMLDWWGTPWQMEECIQSADHVATNWSDLVRANQYKLQILISSHLGNHISIINPVQVSPGVPWAATSTIITPTPLTSVMGSKTIVEWYCKDKYNNKCAGDQSGQFSVVVARLGGSPYDTPMYASTGLSTLVIETGRYQASFVIMLIGNFTATLRMGDIRGITVGAPIVVSSIPAETAISLSYASLATSPRKLLTSKVPAKVVAGATNVVRVVGVDVNGNLQDNSKCNSTVLPNVTISTDDMGLDGAGAGVPPFVVYPDVVVDTTNPGCVFWYNFSATAVAKVGTNPPATATYTMRVTWAAVVNGAYSDIAGSPFKFQVKPAAMDIPSSLLQLSSRSASSTGLTTTFLLTTKDIYGNQATFSQSLSLIAIVAPAGTYTPQRRRLLKYGVDEDDVQLEEEMWQEQRRNYFVARDASAPVALMTPSIVSNPDATYSISFSVIQARSYDIFVYMSGSLLQPMLSSMATIANFLVPPGWPEITRVRPIGVGIGDGVQLVVGRPITLTISLCDIFSNPVSIANSPSLLQKYMAGIANVSTITMYRSNIGNNTFSITPVPVSGVNFSILGGNITFSCTPTMAGFMSIALAYTDSGGSSVTKSALGPFYMSVVVNGQVAPSTFLTFGPGVTAAPACSEDICPINTMYIKITDANNNLQFPSTTVCQNFIIVGWNAGVMIWFTAKPIYDNYCALSWKLLPGLPPARVAFNVSYSSNGTTTPVPADPRVSTADPSGLKFTVPIVPEVGDPAPDKCLAFGDLGGLVMAGTVGRITVQLVDLNGVAVQTSPSTNGDYVTLIISATNYSMNPPWPPTVSTTDNGDGTYSLQYDTSRAGMFTMMIYVGYFNMPLGGRTTGYILNVVAATSVVESTIVTLVSNNSDYRAGQDTVQIQLQAVDNYLNLQDHVLSTVDSFQARITQPDGSLNYVGLASQTQTASDTGNYYVSWVLNFVPSQAGIGSTYSFNFVWRNDTVEIPIPASTITIPTIPGVPSPLYTKVLGAGASTSHVGQWSALSIQLYDSLKNPITEVQDIVNADVFVALTLGRNYTTIQANCTISINPSAVVCQYMVTVPGWYNLYVYSGPTKLRTLGVTVGVGLISGPNCIASGDGVGTTGMPLFPGALTTFNIFAFDRLNNSIPQNLAYFEVKGENTNQSGVILPRDGYPKYISGNSFQVQYIPLQAGIYNLFVRRANMDIVGSPYQIEVQVGPAAPNCILDDQSLHPCSVMSTKNITLWSRDAYGNIRATQQDVFHVFVTVDGFPYLAMEDIMVPLGGGAYGFSFPCLNDTFVQITNDAVLVFSGKIYTTVGPADPTQTTLSLDDASIPAGQYGHGLIVTRDFAGHQLRTGQQSLFISYGISEGQGSENGTMMVTDRGDGTYDLTYVILSAGIYQLQGTLNEYWPFYDGLLFVNPSSPHTAAMYFDPNGYVVGTAGVFQIQYFEEHLNNISDSAVLETSSLSLSYMSWDCPARTARYSSATLGIQFNATTGFYMVTFQPIMAGRVFVNLKVNGMEALNEDGFPYSAQVEYLPPSPSTFDIWGPGIEIGGILGENSFFYVRNRDATGTILLGEPGDVFDVVFNPQGVVPWMATSAYLNHGTTLFTYSLVNNASFSISVYYGGQLVHNPYRVNLVCKDIPGAVSVRHSAVLGPDSSELTTGVPLEFTVANPNTTVLFTIQCRDQDGMIITTPNPNYPTPNFTVTVVGDGPPLASFQVINQLDGWWYQFYVPLRTKSGDIHVQVQSWENGALADVKNSGFTIYLAPGVSSPANTKIVRSSLDLNSITKVVAGQTIEITVQPYDAYGNMQVYNLYVPDVFSATLNLYPGGETIGPVAIGLDNGDNTYTLKLKATAAGSYNVTLFLNDKRFNTIPVAVVISELWLSSLLIVDSVDPMQVDVASTLLLQATDLYQNPIFDAGDVYCVFQHNVSYERYNTMVVASNDTVGQFWVYYTPIKSGHYHIIVGDAVSRNVASGVTLMEIDVWPGPVSIDLTTTSIPYQVFQAGQMATIYIIAMDAKSNPNYATPIVRISDHTGEMDAQVTSPCPPVIVSAYGSSPLCQPINPMYTSYATFSPTSYGKMNITIEWDEATKMTYSEVPVQPGTKPLPLTAKLSQNLGSIVVKFDIPTDAGYLSFGSIISAHTSGWQRCNNTLDSSFMEKIGVNPNCAFQDATTLTIQLGFNATIRAMDSGAGDNISIANGIYNQGDTSMAISGWVPLGITDSCPPPVAQLIGPQITSVCDDLVLDASSSSGAAGRPMTYKFTVKGTGNPNKLAALGFALDAMASNMMVTIAAGQLDPDQSYLFTVTVTNYLGMTSAAKLTIQVVDASIPQVSIRDNAAVIEVMRWETIELEAIAHLANVDTYQLDGTCGSGNAKSSSKKLKGLVQMPLMYEWTQTGYSLLDQDAVGWNARTLNVPGNLLRPGLLYNFQVRVWPQGSPQLSAIANVSIHATPSPLAIKIKGGNRVVNATEDLYVEASVYDPDDSVEAGTNQPYPFEISWTCNNIVLSDHFDATLYPDVSGPLKRVLLIKSSWLTDGMNYTFTATVARAPYTDASRTGAKASVNIMASNNAMTVVATIDSEAEIRTLGVSPARMLKVMCSPGLGSYQWSVTSNSDGRTISEMQVVKLDEHTLRVDPYTLVAGATYNFICTVTNQVATGSGSVAVSTLPDPSGGTVEFKSSPLGPNIAGVTSYSLRAYGWTPGGDLTGQLKYEFRYIVIDSEGHAIKEVIIHPPSTVNKVNSVYVLPGTIVFRVYVINPGPIRFMPNDAPYGAVFELPPIFVTKGNGRRRLLSLPSLVTNYYDFAKKGMYYCALVSIDAYSSITFPNPAGGCGGGGNKKTIKDMLKTMEVNDPQYPPASQGNTIQSGSGPYIALMTASIYSKLIDRAGNLNFEEFKMALHIFLQKLERVAAFGIKVPTSIASPVASFLDAGDAFLKAVKLKCFKTSTQAQAVMDRVSLIPIGLAETVFRDVGFVSPTVVDRSTFTIGTMSFKLPEHPFNPFGGPVYLTGQVGNLFATVAVRKGGGQEFGMALACFNKLSPLSLAGTASLNRDGKLSKLIVVCDVLTVGLTTTDFLSLTVTATWTELPRLDRGSAYKAVQIDKTGTANTSLLQNIVSRASGVSFDLATPYSRIAVTRVQAADDFTPVGWQNTHDKYKPPKQPKSGNTTQTVSPTTLIKPVLFGHTLSGSSDRGHRQILDVVFVLLPTVGVGILHFCGQYML